MTLTIQTVEEAGKTIKTNDIVLFMKGTKEMPMCGFSSTIVKILNHYNVIYKTTNVLDDPQIGAIAETISEYSAPQ